MVVGFAPSLRMFALALRYLEAFSGECPYSESCIEVYFVPHPAGSIQHAITETNEFQVLNSLAPFCKYSLH